LIAYFDSDRDGKLSYKETMEVMLPCDDLVLRAEVSQRQSRDCPRTHMLNCTVERELAFLLESEIDYHVCIERAKQDLTARYDWSCMQAFETVDKHRERFLGYQNVQDFCRQNGFNATELDIVAVIRRMDIDADQRVCFDEF
jgi:Ca2+-binding EF-hand superfamily protein